MELLFPSSAQLLHTLRPILIVILIISENLSAALQQSLWLTVAVYSENIQAALMLILRLLHMMSIVSKPMATIVFVLIVP